MGPQIHDGFSGMLYHDNLKVSHKAGRTSVVVGENGTIYVLLILWACLSHVPGMLPCF